MAGQNDSTLRQVHHLYPLNSLKWLFLIDTVKRRACPQQNDCTTSAEEGSTSRGHRGGSAELFLAFGSAPADSSSETISATVPKLV